MTRSALEEVDTEEDGSAPLVQREVRKASETLAAISIMRTIALYIMLAPV
jgi:hypothetical protein